MNKIIWVLNDGRAGNYTQALGLAEEISRQTNAQIQIKKITYNFFSGLPNFLKINGICGINEVSRSTILNQIEVPQIIISAGRKTAPIAAYLRKQYDAFVIQIMNPNFNFDKFDVVILPNHDSPTKAKNVINITGSITRINQEILNKEYEKFSEILNKIPSPKIALLVGGSSKKGKFTEEIAVNLGKQISVITNKMKANLLVLNSRRTGEKITEILDQNLNCQGESRKEFFKWTQNSDWKNPYFAVLKAADFVVATGDSISMCSEICSLGKPVYIFNPKILCPKKHLRFHQNLFDGKYAKKLGEDLQILENYKPNILDETKSIANTVLKMMSGNNS